MGTPKRARGHLPHLPTEISGVGSSQKRQRQSGPRSHAECEDAARRSLHWSQRENAERWGRSWECARKALEHEGGPGRCPEDGAPPPLVRAAGRSAVAPRGTSFLSSAAEPASLIADSCVGRADWRGESAGRTPTDASHRGTDIHNNAAAPMLGRGALPSACTRRRTEAHPRRAADSTTHTAVDWTASSGAPPAATRAVHREAVQSRPSHQSYVAAMDPYSESRVAAFSAMIWRCGR